MVEICIECNEDRQIIIKALDNMYRIAVLAEQDWLRDKNKQNKSDNLKQTKEKYSKILQGGIIHLLLTATDKMSMKLDKITGKRTIKTSSAKMSLEIILNEFSIKLAQQESEILAVMIQKLTLGEQGLLSISLADLAWKLGKYNIKKAQESIKASLENIRGVALKVDGKDFKGKPLYFNSALCDTAIIKNSVVQFAFGRMVEDYLLNKNECKPMSIDEHLFQIQCSKTQNPYVWAIGFKIFYLANFNRFKDKKKISFIQ